MKEPFKVGDRVAVYGQCNSGVFELSMNGERCSIYEIDMSGWIIVRRKNGIHKYWFHPKQCRRLVKKKRREFWILEKQSDMYYSEVFHDFETARKKLVNYPTFTLTHVREVKK